MDVSALWAAGGLRAECEGVESVSRVIPCRHFFHTCAAFIDIIPWSVTSRSCVPCQLESSSLFAGGHLEARGTGEIGPGGE